MRKHSKKRHPRTGEIINDLLAGLLVKQITHKWNVHYNTVTDIKNKFIGVVRYVKSVRDPNQYELDV